VIELQGGLTGLQGRVMQFTALREGGKRIRSLPEGGARMATLLKALEAVADRRARKGRRYKLASIIMLSLAAIAERGLKKAD
jgi:hypothetical protein